MSQSSSMRRTLIFTIVLCTTCALVLALLASGLKEPQEEAKKVDRYQEMLKSTQLLSLDGYFQISTQDAMQPASNGVEAPLFLRSSYHDQQLIANPNASQATSHEIKALFNQCVHPMLVDAEGTLQSFDEAQIDYATYLEAGKKLGYSQLPHKLIYVVYPAQGSVDRADARSEPISYIIPVNGQGLWAPIYGYIAIESGCHRVLGISWYEHQETPGLGANISTPKWQRQFFGKTIFQALTSGEVDPEKSPLGITVVKGKVSDVYGEDPRGASAVDGMSGATITGNGVTAAYKRILEEYRPFLVKHYSQRGGDL